MFLLLRPGEGKVGRCAKFESEFQGELPDIYAVARPPSPKFRISESPRLAQPHLTLNHLLKHMETYAAKRNNRDVRPDWVTQFIDQVAELFEPLAGVGRVGFDCQLAEDCWVVGMYLGCTETVGGSRDGSVQHVNFELDLAEVIGFFDSVDEFYLGAFPEPKVTGDATARSYVTMTGVIDGSRLRLQVFSIPPDDAGPGLRQYPNGECEAV